MKNFFLLSVALAAILCCLSAASQTTDSGKNSQGAYVTNDSAKIFLDSANYYKSLGNFEDAGRCSRLAAEIQPENAEAYVGWFQASAQMGRFDDGLMAIDQWILNNPGDTLAWLYKAFLEAHLEHPEEALKAFDTLIKLQPERSSNWIGRGQMLYDLGRYDDALEAFNIGLAGEPSRNDVQGMKAATLAKLGQFDEALMIISESMEQNPDDPMLIYNRACVYSISGDREKALSDLKKAISLDASVKEYARTDEDFVQLYDDEEFVNLVK